MALGSRWLECSYWLLPPKSPPSGRRRASRSPRPPEQPSPLPPPRLARWGQDRLRSHRRRPQDNVAGPPSGRRGGPAACRNRRRQRDSCDLVAGQPLPRIREWSKAQEDRSHRRTPQTLCDVQASGSGVWLSDNRILFTGMGALRVVLASGGMPTPLTTIERSRNDADTTLQRCCRTEITGLRDQLRGATLSGSNQW
jgi:hypothetical protein